MNGYRAEIIKLVTIDSHAEFVEDITRWLERRIPKGYYGRLDIPIEDGRVSIVKVTRGTRPRRKQK
jgi:hypothetical protein